MEYYAESVPEGWRISVAENRNGIFSPTLESLLISKEDLLLVSNLLNHFNALSEESIADEAEISAEKELIILATIMQLLEHPNGRSNYKLTMRERFDIFFENILIPFSKGDLDYESGKILCKRIGYNYVNYCIDYHEDLFGNVNNKSQKHFLLQASVERCMIHRVVPQNTPRGNTDSYEFFYRRDMIRRTVYAGLISAAAGLAGGLLTSYISAQLENDLYSLEGGYNFGKVLLPVVFHLIYVLSSSVLISHKFHLDESQLNKGVFLIDAASSFIGLYLP